MNPDPRTSPDGSPRVLAGPLSTTGYKGDSPALNPFVFVKGSVEIMVMALGDCVFGHAAVAPAAQVPRRCMHKSASEWSLNAIPQSHALMISAEPPRLS
ncbi:MAG: hypothetical protein HY401_06175 [Elusimicrobia bacterium]|nr:hypothetical protein [Elusimicrobiota bacterium]